MEHHSVKRRRIPPARLGVLYSFSNADEVFFPYLFQYCNFCTVSKINKGHLLGISALAAAQKFPRINGMDSIQQSDSGGQGQPMAADDRKLPPVSSVTTKEAVSLFEDGGVPRSLRSIERYCKRGRLDAYLHPDEDTYYIEPESIERLIEELRQLQERRFNRAPSPVATAAASGRHRKR